MRRKIDGITGVVVRVGLCYHMLCCRSQRSATAQMWKTALHAACESGHVGVVNKLVAGGANVNANFLVCAGSQACK